MKKNNFSSYPFYALYTPAPLPGAYFFPNPLDTSLKIKLRIDDLIGQIRLFHYLEYINQRKVKTNYCGISFEQCQVIEIPKNLAWIFVREVKKCLAECTPHGLKVLGCKVRVCASS